MIRIYLDWNVITNLISTDRISDFDMHQDFILLKSFCLYPNDKLIIPYTNAHLQDLMKSYTKGERDRVDSSLAYLSNLTKNVCLAQYWNEENATWHSRDPREFFNSILEDDEDLKTSWEDIFEVLNDSGMGKVFNTFKELPHGIDIEEIEKHNPFVASMFARARVETSMYAFLQDIFDLLSIANSNPTVYRELRKVFKTILMIDPNISNYDKTIEQLDKYLPKTMLNKSFSELYEMNKNSYSKNKAFEKLVGIYMQLDFVGFNSDKISDKNLYGNIFNDALHCFYAAHCDFYITDDKRNFKKSKAVYESENIPTQVLKTSEFINDIVLKNE